MAIHGGSQRSKPVQGTNSFSDHIQLTHALNEDDSSLNLSSNLTMASSEKPNNVFIVFIFILEVLVLIFVAVLAYFLRDTDVFPVREVNFSCSDASINHKPQAGEDTYDDFAYNADVPYEVVLGLSFAVPCFIMIVCEIAVWAFSDERQKTVRAMCSFCKVPQVIRRIIRFIGTFLFGILVTMIITDVTKLFTGRLRPTFLHTCKPNVTLCSSFALDDSVCRQDDEDKLREARLSFPSFHAAVSSYAAFYLAIYLHNIIRNPSVRIIRSFMALSFIILSIMCGLARYGLHYSHWTDVLAGFILGLLMAVYLCLYVVNGFREHLDGHQLYNTLKGFLVRQRLIEFRDLYKENWERLEHDYPLSYGGCPGYLNYAFNTQPDLYSNGLLIPRPHVHGSSMESNTDHLDGREAHFARTPPLPPRTPDRTAKQRPVSNYHNTFQRDLHRAVEPYRGTYRDYNERHRHPINGGHI